MCTSVLAVLQRIRVRIFNFQPLSRGTGSSTSQTTLQCTEPKSTSPSHSCGEQNRSIPSHDQSVRRSREYVPRRKAVQGDPWWPTFGAFCFPKTEEASFRIVWRRDQNDKKHADYQANVCHFELSRKRRVPRLCTRDCMSHGSLCVLSPILAARNRPARVSGQIASDHCRSDLSQSHSDSHTPYEVFLNKFLWPMC